MARHTKLVRGPAAGLVRTGAGSSGYKITAGSMGAAVMAPNPQADLPQGDTAFEPEAPVAVSDDAWAQTLAAREAAEGLASAPEERDDRFYREPPGAYERRGGLPAHQPRAPADLTGLPERFSLEIETKPDGWWVVRAPEVHVGLFIAHQDLLLAIADAPVALAAILRLDGLVPKEKRRKRGTRGNA